MKWIHKRQDCQPPLPRSTCSLLSDRIIILGLFFSSSVFPVISQGFTTVGDILCMWPFFNPTIEVTTFPLCGWCMLGLFLLLAFNHLRHECQDLESLQWNACMQRQDFSLYSHPKEFWGNGARTYANPREKSPILEIQRRVELAMLHHTGQWAQHTTDSAILALGYSLKLGTMDLASMLHEWSTLPVVYHSTVIFLQKILLYRNTNSNCQGLNYEEM